MGQAEQLRSHTGSKSSVQGDISPGYGRARDVLLDGLNTEIVGHRSPGGADQDREPFFRRSLGIAELTECGLPLCYRLESAWRTRDATHLSLMRGSMPP